ncbi:hypothetical protein AAG747_25945 [Rapidithrix thailandica]|uniref:Lipocalin-like domain-containing protein n=1 Tax=Rapidithrix thailandica TaxID=413964 RepID=A0AAW9SFL7_9BACT
MRAIKLFGILLLVLALLGFSSHPVEHINKKPRAVDLVGTWELVSSKIGNAENYTLRKETIGYKKLITPGYFTWISYDLESMEVTGLGGGKYNVGEDEYVEHIEYFFPAGSNLQGVSLPFEMRIENNQWFHSGYVLERELNTEQGEYVVVGRTYIQEVWRKID